MNLQQNLSSKLALLLPGCVTHPIIDSMPAKNSDGDSTEQITILGAQRSNPYTVANMAQAYNNLGVTNVTVTAKNQYVRFLPSSVVQLSMLDSVLEAQNLEMFDAPMDYDVVKEGDYYQDPSIPDSMVTWHYAVVPTTFQAPAGITYQVLSAIHIPTDTYVGVETEAERLSSIQDSIASGGGGALSIAPVPNVVQCLSGYHWNLTTKQCVCDCCPTGYQYNGTQCVPITTPSTIPPPSADQAVPAGNITVTDNNLNITPGVRNVRIIAKRWFKIERSYTDNVGHFLFTKRFKHKVKLVVKFKNDFCNIRSIRGVRLWQSLYVARKTIGVYSGNKSNIPYNFPISPNSTNARGNSFWTAATVINTVQEQRDYSVTYAFSAPPMGLNIYITNWGSFEGLASTPLFGKRFQNIFSSFVNTFLVHNVTNATPLVGFYVSFFTTIFRVRLDIAIDYHRGTMAAFTSDYIKGTLYHELCHASQYTQVGNGWYTNFVNAELNQIVAHPGKNDPFNPYGISTSPDAPLIALGEAWGYHMGHFLADQRYGLSSAEADEQGIGYLNNNPVAGLSSHLNLLEDFDPSRTGDPFWWIPKGLMYDLMDARNDNSVAFPRVLLNDIVSGYTVAQLFNALQSDVNTLQQYHTRLSNQNTNNPAGVNIIFSFYGY